MSEADETLESQDFYLFLFVALKARQNYTGENLRIPRKYIDEILLEGNPNLTISILPHEDETVEIEIGEQ